MSSVSVAPAFARRLRRSALALATVCLCMSISTASAVAQPPPPPDPPAALNSFIDPAVLESLQQSIVGVVTIWEEPVDPLGMAPVPGPQDPVAPPELPVLSLCSGWFDSPTTIATAGHCVDPKEGRLAMDMQDVPVDPETGMPLPPDPARPEPKRTVYAFQPRELPGAVLTSPVVVRVHSFRPAEEGDTAKLEVHGMPPASPLPIASTTPRLGETVTSIGFPGLNISETDGINLDALLSGGKTPAEVLQDSRLQPVNTSGTITARQFRQGVAVYQVGADFDDGMSGGPTVNSRGEVYGINSQMTLPFFGQNFNVITDTGMLREFLGHDEQPRQEAPTNAPVETTSGISDPSIGWAIVLSALGGAALGGLLVWRIRRLKG
jgi:hypothetical protein